MVERPRNQDLSSSDDAAARLSVTVLGRRRRRKAQVVGKPGP
jgi:hypothetical protein